MCVHIHIYIHIYICVYESTSIYIYTYRVEWLRIILHFFYDLSFSHARASSGNCAEERVDLLSAESTSVSSLFFVYNRIKTIHKHGSTRIAYALCAYF